MKKSDIAMIVLLTAVSALISYFAVNALFEGDVSEKKYTVKVTEAIVDKYTEPSSEIFNKDAVNPTVQVEIGD